MALVDIQVIEGVFTPQQKADMIAKITDTMVGIEGENMRGITWVRVSEFATQTWGIGGHALTTEDVQDMAAG
jgi:4-oxalocrotonate tautomerase